MSKIPSGLTAKQMRLRMLDKATMRKTGSLYMGGSTVVSYQGVTDTIYEIEELEAGNQYFPLLSQGENSVLHYSLISTTGLQDNSISKSKLGNGTIHLSTDGSRKDFNISYTTTHSSDEPDSIVLSLGNDSYTIAPAQHKAMLQDIKQGSLVDCNAIKVQINNNVEAVWCKSYTLTDNNSGYGTSGVSYTRTGNLSCPRLNTGNIIPNENFNIFYDDRIIVNFSPKNEHYTVICVCTSGDDSYQVFDDDIINAKDNCFFDFRVQPDIYNIYFNGDAGIDSYGVTLLNSPSTSIPVPFELSSGNSIYEGDTIQFHATAVSPVDYNVVCQSSSGSPTRTYPLDTPITVDHDMLTFVNNNINLVYQSVRKVYNLTLTLNTGVASIRYRQSIGDTSWHTITSTQTVQINSGANVELQFTPASGYIATEGFYKVTTSYGSSYKIAHMRSNQSWTPTVYHQGQGIASVTASASTSGSRRTYTLVYTNNSALDRQKLMSTNVGVSINGATVNGGMSRTFTNTVQGTTPITDDYCYVHFYVGNNPYAADTIHYGVVGTYTHD